MMKYQAIHRSLVKHVFWVLAFCSVGSWSQVQAQTTKKLKVETAVTYQTLDGFGTNVTPAQWREGKLKPALDRLVDDVGCHLIRFDAYGDGDWLDPAKLQADGTFPENYLAEVYQRPVFRDAWETARYLQSKNVELIFNVSGDIPAAWKDPQTQTLNQFEAYAEMQASLLKWARDKEKIKFRYFMPCNEMDLKNNVEGPSLPTANDRFKLWKVIHQRLKDRGLGDLKHIIFCDAGLSADHIRPVLQEPDFTDVIHGFSAHTYGNGLEGDAGQDWLEQGSPYLDIANAIENSPYRGKKFWLTEYGDLDQTGEIEWEVAWRMNRRLMKALEHGLHAALTWDAFDNYHVHDQAWATYGLLHTDQKTWVYTPKKRYHATKHFFKFLRPGSTRVRISSVEANPQHVDYS